MDTTTPPPIVQPSPPPERRVRIGPIVRDVIIVWVLTVLGGVVVGVAIGPQRDAHRFYPAVFVSNALLGTVGFTIAGCLAPPGRWRHLGLVALGTWLTGIINVAFFGVTIPQWIASAIFMAVFMSIGGSISYAFK